MTRTDVHRPSAFVAADYTYVTAIDTNPEPENLPARRLLASDFVRNIRRNLDTTAPGWDEDEGRGMHQCHVCGSFLRYAVVWAHTPTGKFIVTGEDCADLIDDTQCQPWGAELGSIRSEAQLHRELGKVAKLREQFEAASLDNYLAATVARSVQADHDADGCFHCDTARRYHQYGSLSERQVSALLASRARIIAKAEREARWAAERAAEAANASPVVTGKAVEVTGEVVTVKFVENDFGGALKMLVRDDRGFKVWGTVPASIVGGESYRDEDGNWAVTPGADPGKRVQFTASVEASDDDEAFGFFKRPRKAQLVG